MRKLFVVGIYSVRITEHTGLTKSGLKLIGEDVAFLGHYLERFGLHELFFAVFNAEENAFNTDT